MNEPLSDHVGPVPLSRCAGCNRAFDDDLPIASWLPHMIDFTDEENPTIKTRLPLCSECARRWCDDDGFQVHCDRATNTWLAMDSLLKGARADAIT